VKPVIHITIKLWFVYLFFFLFGFFIGRASASELRQWKHYPGTEWTTVYGGPDAIDEFCKRYLKNPPRRKVLGCLIARHKVIACSSLSVCLHEAVHAADKEWSHIPRKLPLFDPKVE